ncbi:MAG: hypothetical protein JO053_04130 [Acidobacteria bacterium]|nr:hypothetical protein [Acidobacteriota bacterium]
MDPGGTERRRLEGYLPKDDFGAFLEIGLARLAFLRKDFMDAERRYTSVIDGHAESVFAPEAVYYLGVSRYSASHDHEELPATANQLQSEYPGTEWQLRSIPWLPENAKSSAG